MTTTLDRPDAETRETVEPVGFTIDYSALADLASVVVVTVDHRDARPILEGIHLTARGTGGETPDEVVATATDSYALARVTRPATVTGSTGDVLVNGRALVAALKTIKPGKYDDQAVTVRDAGGYIELTRGDAIARAETIAGDFPNVNPLIPAGNGIAEMNRLSLNAGFLAKMAKLPSGEGSGQTWRLVHAESPLKPVMWVSSADAMFLLMPVRDQ